nr:tyrosine-type recombinase/integrase [Corynebacterium sp. LK27]
MNLAVEYGYLTSNPVHVRVASRKPQSKRKELPTTEQFRAILEHVPHRYRLITVLCLFHGLRLGEALALHGKHVFPDKVIIEGTLARVPNGKGGVKMELHPPKTQAGYRTVPIMPEFQHIITEHLATYQPRPEGYATETDNGAVVFDTSYRSIFYRAKDKAGIEDDLTPHYGRVYLITRLAEAGATPREIGLILGQEDVSTIVNTYMRARQRRANALMSSVNLED